MSKIDYAAHARVLWHVAHGQEPLSTDAKWPEFVDAVRDALRRTADVVGTEAYCAVSYYEPIPVDGMAEPYRRAFEATKKGCESEARRVVEEHRAWLTKATQ